MRKKVKEVIRCLEERYRKTRLKKIVELVSRLMRFSRDECKDGRNPEKERRTECVG